MVEIGARRATCGRCKRPLSVCYCSYLPQQRVQTKQTHVLVLQHEHENRRRAAISSVPVLTKTLENVTLATLNEACDCGPGVNDELDAFLYNERDGNQAFDATMILFPAKHAQTLAVTNMEAQIAKKQVLLIVIDGTWKQAKKIVHRNQRHWEVAARDWNRRGASFQYVCLEKTNERGERATSTSIYGALRREPMDGCLSTLEAVASALMILEPQETRHVVHDSLLHAFQGMVSLQTPFHQRGQRAKLQQCDDISKAHAVEMKRQRPQQQQQPLPKTSERVIPTTSTSVQHQYVFYTTHMDFRHRQQLVQHVSRSYTTGRPILMLISVYCQQSDVVVCTYDEAKARCRELNHDRKRGQRVDMLRLEVFMKHLAQCHDEILP
ncbi:hypothetical protein PsorP6_011897 [Peronosclerospora sorghi]|uniref:Uncharacterized protein n=1 Tax=Peronosclerospora sorghi TaxID=230839 RepID=A0ACC0WK67_9STRA|nr:hypothetical protein PsorP6_011897 [Peronosclerospora sorghi]